MNTDLKNRKMLLLKEIQEIEHHEKKIEEKHQKIYEEKCQKTEEKILSILKLKKDDFKKISVSTPNIKNSIITAPTQVGKTKSIIKLCKATEGWLTIISCDDKIDQMNQIFNRLKTECLNVYKISNVKFDKIYEHLSAFDNVIIVMLNNKSQVSKTTALVKKLHQKCEIKKYLCIHDESDMVNKSDDIKTTGDLKIAASHQEWIKHFEEMKKLQVPIRRVWVTATCENCSSLYNIQAKDISVIPTPRDYRPVNMFIPWKGEQEPLYAEIERIKSEKNGEVILYCYDRLIAEQHKSANELTMKTKCISIVYNSDGITLYKYSRITQNVSKNTLKNYSIDYVLEKLKKTKSPVVIFGNDLMNRGISFVGNGQNPMTATIMFYKSSKTSHSVGIAQKIGRISGTSRPDLENRKIYCRKEVYNDYCSYLKNQQKVYEALEEYPNADMVEILKELDSYEIKRPVDRPVLKKVNKEYKEASSASPSTTEEEIDSPSNSGKMKRLVKSWSKPTNKTDIAKLFREMINNRGSMENFKVKEITKELGNNYYNNLTSPVNNKWNVVFYKDDNNHYICDEAMNYYNTMEYKQ